MLYGSVALLISGLGYDRGPFMTYENVYWFLVEIKLGNFKLPYVVERLEIVGLMNVRVLLEIPPKRVKTLFNATNSTYFHLLIPLFESHNSCIAHKVDVFCNVAPKVKLSK